MVTVVTGASGFLGGVLVRSLLAHGRHVRAVDLRRGPSLEGLEVEFQRADVRDGDAVQAALRGASTVFHTAAVISVTGDRSGKVRDVNVNGVRTVAEAALDAGVDRFVHCSSVHAFDLELDGELTEASPRATDPHLPPYDRSKAAGEAALREVVERGLDAVVCNPTGVIGPHDINPSRMGVVILALFRGRMPALIDGGFNWVDVRDVVAGLLAAEAQGRTGENYLLPGHQRSLLEMAIAAEEVSGVPRPRRVVPMWLARTVTPIGNVVSGSTGNPLWATSESLHALRFSPPVSGAKARTELGYAPRPFVETIGETYRWFEDRGLLPRSEPGPPGV